MKLVCEYCGNNFEGKNEKFCSNECKDSHIISIEKTIYEAVQSDSSHTDDLSTK